jgi:UDP-2,3-diacylglucosamine pyrophosphatase LpxH
LYKKTIVLSDQHIPFHDKKVNDLIIDNFLPEFKPDYIKLLGDMIDFWMLSKFRKNPSRKGSIQTDINEANTYLKRIREKCPDSEITLHYGNHVCRLKKYIWDKASELDCLDAIDIKVLLDIDKLNIKVIDSEQGYETKGNLIFTHGTVVSSDSAMTARRNLAKYGLSVICGHTHRLGSTYKTDCRGTIGAWENGCLCNLDLIREWGSELANWQTGFSTVIWWGDHFQVQQIPIIKNKFIYGEKIYEYGKP